ncbi:MAG TPA: cytochrome c biogenesis protein CcsA [Anaerohalosphaeraceae bacterium]|nr:cytochrome c biogenesis protein CcsA [Phycisphaerae bacterium]HOK96253.1 cytochrome c biogenesis protein CcsA [Anaerohalosphaeraceae bacterium]HOL32133.1 cytochrome c biogenesis protein CcsA [Anaerohalosphaeraceae bacterium]HOM76673.1 cytochrome c biogenesis protein CcsA [Anaerohalosphaeraceae bacterium]HPC65075.1 cytochrome c biogenesis protein CcsA [Anaerohalosphaeraceae bacterium]
MMAIKTDLQGCLIYAVMLGYLAVLCLARRHPKQAKAVFLCSFLLSAVAFIYRWAAVGHLPMQNMFEVFVFLGFCIWPIHQVSKKLLSVDYSVLLMIDAAVGLIVLFPAGFVFHHKPQYLPPALQFWLFGPHVAAYMLAYIFMTKAAVFGLQGMRIPAGRPENAAIADYSYRLIAAGFPLLTLGLFLGSIWGKYAWGDWWGWDPKELWSLVCWLVYAIYLHSRLVWPKRYSLHHVLAVVGLICIIITLLWVNLSKLFSGMHNYAS